MTDIAGPIRIGTRGSELALAQANELRTRLLEAHPAARLDIQIVPISTKGDRIQDRTLADIGGKGLFTLEIEQQLAAGRIEMAVHSSKDVPAKLPEGLELSCFLPREPPGDAFISRIAPDIARLPQGAVLGSSSLRRQAQAKRLRPDLRIVALRGNVPTRLKKLEAGEVDAILLAEAGLKRLGLSSRITARLPLDDFPPAPGQGAICVETRIGDAAAKALLEPVNDRNTATALSAERAFLGALDGSCRTPLGGYAVVESGRLVFHGMILTPDGRQMHEARLEGPAGEAATIGARAAAILRAEAGPGFFDGWS